LGFPPSALSLLKFYLASDLIHKAIFRASSLGTCGIGGIGVE
jgi:hypothetical protein